MSKIYQELEQIFKFRIHSNSEIPAYLRKLSLIGKIDEVRRQALFTLILNRLGEIEDQELIQTQVIEPFDRVSDPKITGLEGILTKDGIPVYSNDEPIPKELMCPTCNKVSKSKLGNLSHQRSHNKV